MSTKLELIRTKLYGNYKSSDNTGSVTTDRSIERITSLEPFSPFSVYLSAKIATIMANGIPVSKTRAATIAVFFINIEVIKKTPQGKIKCLNIKTI